MPQASALFRDISMKLLFCSFFACMGAFTLGFDQEWFAAGLGNAHFAATFGDLKVTSATGVVSKTLSTEQTSVGSTLGTVGLCIGCILAGVLCRKFGRKGSFYITAGGSLCGIVCQVTSSIHGARYWQLAIGKLIICSSLGISTIAIPLYLSEVSPASVRGALTNAYIEIQTLGAFMGVVVMYLVQNSTTQIVWMLPIGIQFIAPLVTFALARFLPESPRWLVEMGRHDEARESLVALNKGKEGYDVEKDFEEIEAAHTKLQAKGEVSWKLLFTKGNLKRTLIVIGVQCWQQGMGLGFMGNYLVLFIIQLGIPNVYQILMIYIGLVLAFTATGFWTQDFFGRRWLLIGGAGLQGASMLGMAAITTVAPSPTGGLQIGALVCIGLWFFAFTQSWTNVPWSISSEVPSDQVRDKTMSLAAALGFVISIIITQVSPYLQNVGYGDLGGKIGYIWGAISAMTTVWCYFMIPELKGRSLEEVEWLFSNGIPIRKMGGYQIPEGALLDLSSETAEVIPYDGEKEKDEYSHLEEK